MTPFFVIFAPRETPERRDPFDGTQKSQFLTTECSKTYAILVGGGGGWVGSGQFVFEGPGIICLIIVDEK